MGARLENPALTYFAQDLVFKLEFVVLSCSRTSRT